MKVASRLMPIEAWMISEDDENPAIKEAITREILAQVIVDRPIHFWRKWANRSNQ